ncbi:MAG: crotonase/enoyl-CoA hydratase family protein [Pseudomonadota bacterium]
MSNPVCINIDDHVATVTLSRGNKMNALDKATFEGLVQAAQSLQQDPTVRAVVIHGSGENFCSGLDKSMFEMFSNGNKLADRTHGITNLFQQVAWAWHELKVPVIAAVEGYCIGGGLQIASGADMRYVHPDARMSIMEIKWGLIPDMAGTQLWRSFVKQDLLRELTYTGEVFDGTTASDYGFATRLTDTPLELAQKTARSIAEKSPDAIRASKVLLNQQDYLSFEQGLLLESELQDEIIGQPNQIEAVFANMDKRKPVFSSADEQSAPTPAETRIGSRASA